MNNNHLLHLLGDYVTVFERDPRVTDEQVEYFNIPREAHETLELLEEFSANPRGRRLLQAEGNFDRHLNVRRSPRFPQRPLFGFGEIPDCGGEVDYITMEPIPRVFSILLRGKCYDIRSLLGYIARDYQTLRNVDLYDFIVQNPNYRHIVPHTGEQMTDEELEAILDRGDVLTSAFSSAVIV